MFEALEARKDELGVSDVILSLTTMEEVFLKVAEHDQFEKEAKPPSRTAVWCKRCGICCGCCLLVFVVLVLVGISIIYANKVGFYVCCC
jgi:hypothetical protein